MALLRLLLLRCFSTIAVPGKRYSCEDAGMVLRTSTQSLMASAVDCSIGSPAPSREQRYPVVAVFGAAS